MFYLELERPNEMEIQVVGLPVLLSGAGKWCEKEKVAQMQLLIEELHEMVTGFGRQLGFGLLHERVIGSPMQLLIVELHEMVMVAQRQPVFLEMVMVALNQPVLGLLHEMVMIVEKWLGIQQPREVVAEVQFVLVP
jgi:hypothetical protein